MFESRSISYEKKWSSSWRHLSSEPLELYGEGKVIDATPDRGYWIRGDYEDRYDLNSRPVTSVGCFGLPAVDASVT